jgi:DNA-binding MarR family transcriptional regulator
MDRKLKQKISKAYRMLSIMSNHTSKHIFETIASHEPINNTEIRFKLRHLDLEQSQVSHLCADLRYFNLVTAERSPDDGREIYYSINHRKIARISRAITEFSKSKKWMTSSAL